MTKQILVIAAAIPALAFTAVAQEDNTQIRVMKMDAERVAAQAKIVSIRTGVLGKTIKNAPYSATEITETNQVLADGTRIHNQTQAQVYRDTEGRTRRETPESITIWDPVAKASYILNPKTQTAQQLPLGGGFFYVAQDGQPNTFRMNLPPPGPEMAKAKAEAEQSATENKVFARTIVRSGGGAGLAFPDPMDFGKELAPGKPESLGTQIIEGVSAEGTRTTGTIATGAIGNDRPLQVVNERWYSPDLQMVVQSRFSDPRTGEQTFRVTNISRNDQPLYLFQVPAGYQVTGPKP